ncbi:MAG: gliding motility-associated C-terminal domain-containing protein, partial [Ginsengibacter sp.]
GRDGADYANKNPYWYKFTCFVSGTLGFVITPKDLTDDYDWQLYDVTGLDPDQVYTNQSIIVTGNWAGNPGATGASGSGVSYIQCASSYNGTENRFSKMPNLIQGHNYILLISHFTDTQSGYSLSFGGGTASITDPKLPDLESVKSSCDAQNIYIKLNKKMKCSSLATNGSDFTVSAAGTNVTGALGVGCAVGFDFDSLVLTLNKPLPPGNWDVVIKNGSDANTLIDNCDRAIPIGRLLKLTIIPLQPTPMDSLTRPVCAPSTFNLVFKKRILCNSIVPDGSDFIITGSQAVTIKSAIGNCENGYATKILVTTNQPIEKGGVYKIILKRGSDGNTLLDECAQETPENSSITFSLKDTVNASFTYLIKYGCETDTVLFFHPGNNGVNAWSWQLDYNGISNQQNPVTYFTSFGEKQIQLSVTNGFCSDTVSQAIMLDNELKAAFETNEIICPEDTAVFLNKSIGNITAYNWDFGNGNTDRSKVPRPQKFPITNSEKTYNIRLTVQNAAGCKSTASQDLKVLKSCYIAVPNAFTPNSDGLNDYLFPLNAFKADGLVFKVYTRAGQLIFSSNTYTGKWDGTFKGEPQDSGVYVWTLQYTLRDTGKKVSMKGSAVLIR